MKLKKNASLKTLALTLAIAGAAYFPAANAQIIDYSQCGANAKYWKEFDQEYTGEFFLYKKEEHRKGASYAETLANYRKLANEVIMENNRMVSKGGTKWQYYVDSGLATAYGTPKIKPWKDGGKEYYYRHRPHRAGSAADEDLKCPTLTQKVQTRDGAVTLPLHLSEGAPKDSYKPYVWDETRFFVSADGRVVGWLESIRGTQLCETAPTPCGSGLTSDERQKVEGMASEVARSMGTWLTAPIKERIDTMKDLTFLGTKPDGNGGKIYEYGYKDVNNRNNGDYSQVSRYFVGRDGIIYGYGGWLNFGEVAICAGGGNLGACGQGGRVLFKKNVSPAQLRRDGK